MGAQPAAELIALLRECEAADEGLIVERKTGELGFDSLSSRYNLPVALALDYELGHITDIDMQDDDRNIRNDITVNRTGGSSARYEVTTGALSISAVGRYQPPDDTINVETDAQLIHHASWRAHLGTVDEPRFPAITINLATNPDIVDAWLACDIGSRITIANLPPDQAMPDSADLIIEGYETYVDGVEWLVTLHCAPSRPYEVYEIEGAGNRGRIPAGTSVTDAQYAASITSLSVTSASKRWIDSATYPSEFPIDIEVAGEAMSCTAISGTGLTQTFTVVRGTHGVARTLPSGSAVQLWRPPATAL
jgi:hypothetical protein